MKDFESTEEWREAAFAWLAAKDGLEAAQEKEREAKEKLVNLSKGAVQDGRCPKVIEACGVRVCYMDPVRKTPSYQVRRVTRRRWMSLR